MSFIGLLLILFAHYLTGNGLLYLFNIREQRGVNIALSFICGVLIVSFIPFILQLFYIPITFSSTSIAIIAFIILLNIKRFAQIKTPKPKEGFKVSFKMPLYEWIFIALIIFLMIPSVWKCFYFPPNARDILSGPEIIAEYAVREHTLLNSVLNINLESTNNHIKPPFVTDLQIIYKLFVQPFGQLWLSVLVLSFLLWLYLFLREKLHPLIAGTLLLFFILIPELYAYTYIIMFDYANMILFFTGVYFLSQYTIKQQYNVLAFSILMFGFSCFIRLETLVLIYMLIPLFLINAYRHKANIKKTIAYTIAFLIVPYFFYFLWIDVFLKHFMPGSFNVVHEINKNLGNIDFYFTRLTDMTTQFLYAGDNINYFAYFINIFTVLFVADIIVSRKLNQEARVGLYALTVLYFGLPLLGYMLPLFDLINTTKRGIFKMFPIMLLLLRNNTLLQKASTSIYNWENAIAIPQPLRAQANTSKQAVNKRKKK